MFWYVLIFLFCVHCRTTYCDETADECSGINVHQPTAFAHKSLQLSGVSLFWDEFPASAKSSPVCSATQLVRNIFFSQIDADNSQNWKQIWACRSIYSHFCFSCLRQKQAHTKLKDSVTAHWVFIVTFLSPAFYTDNLCCHCCEGEME